MITLSFVLIALFSVSLAYFMRNKFSGVDLKRRHVISCICYNFIFGFSYLKLAESGCVTFVGCFPDLEKEYPIVAWGAFLCFLLHGLAHPLERVPRFIIRKSSKFK